VYDQHFKDARVKVRFTNTLRNYGMNVQDVIVLLRYKSIRNKKVHKEKLNRGTTGPELFKQKQDALKLLDIAPDQPQGFQKAFEGCVRWFYRRN